MSYSVLFERTHRNPRELSPTGEDARAVFGRLTIDLREYELDSSPVLLDVEALFGRIIVLTPPEWVVDSQDVDPVFGRVVDKRASHSDRHGDVDVVVSGSAVFGRVIVDD